MWTASLPPAGRGAQDMRNWITEFQRQPRRPDAAPDAAPPVDRPSTARPEAPGLNPPEAAPLPEDGVDLSRRLQAAAGDDAALLALARERVPVEVKLAAVEALAGEAALKQAEVEFRDHDRRVHRLAKQRHERAVATRLARAQAARLIEAAQVLAREPVIPANLLVDLDRDWAALDADLLEPAQRDAHAALMAEMAAHSREQADRPRRLRQWREQAQQVLHALRQACLDAAAHQPDTLPAARPAAQAELPADAQPAALAELPADAQPEASTEVPPEARLEDGSEVPSDLMPELVPDLGPDLGPIGAAAAALRAALDAAPDDPQAASLRAELEGAIAWRARFEDALARVDAWLARPPAGPAELAGPVPEARPYEPVGDAALDAALQARLERRQQASDEAQAAARARRLEQARERERAQREKNLHRLAAELTLGETALDSGQLAAAHRHLVEIDRLLHAGAPASALRGRIDTLQARYAQLKGWQHWAGGRARDDLVHQAEVLAASTSAPNGKPADAQGTRLDGRQLAAHIEQMRARWKELDRLGGATSRALWQRFEAALKTAYQPVAAQIEAQKAARALNLQAREALLAEFEALPAPAAEPGAPAPDWRAVAGRVEQFRTAWRRLGPVEHSVPARAREPIVARMAAAVQRLEAPLDEARQGARREREALVAAARSLAETGGRELGARARELQWAWQQQARAMPLARADEAALWTEFKSALDGAFGAREAAFAARDAEFRAHGAERAALVAGLDALTPEQPAAELRRALAEAEAAWRRTGPAPRQEAADLELRFDRAVARVRRVLADAGERTWRAACDALEARVALCEALEAQEAPEGGGTSAAASEPGVDRAARWEALPPVVPPASGSGLPAEALATLERALAARAGLGGSGGRAAGAGRAPAGPPIDEALLQLEAAWGLASPAAFEESRRLLKLQAMKAALETRRPAATPALAATPLQWLAGLLGRADLDAVQLERLRAVFAELRRRGPAALR